MTSKTDHTPPPEAALIKTALKLTRISGRAAAKQAGISDARWRQIISGYQSVSGTKIAVHAPPDTLARMALVVGVTPQQLAGAGRTDAAEALEELAMATAGQPTGPYANDPNVEAIATLLRNLPAEAQEEVLRRVRSANPADDEPEAITQRRHVG
ncbi:hypothetical protein AB4Z54_22870 [Streptomyces sp. MCAF7]